jgi:hypothetical protein
LGRKNRIPGEYGNIQKENRKNILKKAKSKKGRVLS